MNYEKERPIDIEQSPVENSRQVEELEADYKRRVRLLIGVCAVSFASIPVIDRYLSTDPVGQSLAGLAIVGAIGTALRLSAGRY